MKEIYWSAAGEMTVREHEM
ncbi:Protein CBG25545 [Caenorhabditis briggsae]|uniref:Protein CBG25545 n=1 Tax=Caenorhabditis briggsae TaxID=6238 RepID=B6IIR7_CAEBR|nr:Protein CBG25545 [Caenorhabditis briggsae]CAR99797.1 Protein CBG25545 [Caenorhabditis briggsae]